MKNAPKHKRPSWDEYFIGMANYVGSRATCDRGRSGCVIVRDKRVISTGYVGSPPGLPHCDDIGHEMHKTINENGADAYSIMGGKNFETECEYQKDNGLERNMPQCAFKSLQAFDEKTGKTYFLEIKTSRRSSK